MREALGRLLEISGYAPASYGSAEEFLRAGLEPGVICVVSDVTLPGMSGLDLLDRLRARHTALPVVLITAHDAPGRDREALSRGAVAYLAKPFHGTALLDVIRGISPGAERH
jgi:FixJ family two-component response regulator